jgi:hypothetical protein
MIAANSVTENIDCDAISISHETLSTASSTKVDADVQDFGDSHVGAESLIESDATRPRAASATTGKLDAIDIQTTLDDPTVINDSLVSPLAERVSTTTAMYSADLSVDLSELEKMQTFPSSVPLPDLDGDLEFLDFFDPFLGLPPSKIDALTLPPLNDEGWSPLESFTSSNQTPLQEFGFEQFPMLNPIDTAMASNAGISWTKDDPLRPQPKSETVAWDGVPTSARRMSHALAEGTDSRVHLHPKPSKQPALVFTDSMRAHLIKDLAQRLPTECSSQARLPTAAALQKCIRTYVEAFHVHLPIFHLQTMNFETLPSPLTLAICAIGAQYRLERKVSASLYVLACEALEAAVHHHPRHKPRLLEDWTRPRAQSSKSIPEIVWKGQTRLLLSMQSCFSGDTEVISIAIKHLGDFLIVGRMNITPTENHANGDAGLS